MTRRLLVEAIVSPVIITGLHCGGDRLRLARADRKVSPVIITGLHCGPLDHLAVWFRLHGSPR